MLKDHEPIQRAPNATPKGDERVALLTGERECAACAFNLSGQSIVREPHYGMLIVRCPECGAIAPLQEYPALGPWARRWAAIAAGLYLLVLLAGAFVLGLVGFGLSTASIQRPAEELGLAILERQRAETADSQRTPLTPAGQARASGISAWDTVSAQWLASQDRSKLVRTGGPWKQVAAGNATPIWFAEVIAMFGLGAAAGVILVGVRRTGFIFPALAATSLSAFFLWQRYLALEQGGRFTGRELAEQLLAPSVWGVSLALMFGALLVGMWFGRPLARLVLRALLPPKARNALSIVWTADGLTPNPRKRAPAARA